MTLLGLWFINAALLPFAALAALPVLIYLFNRQRYRPMRWAAMDFVQKAVRSNRSRLKIENLLLLLLRVAAIVLLVLALARPVARPIGPLADLADKRQHVAIVLDASYSMGYKAGAKSSFERAQKAAYDLADDLLKRGDKLAFLVAAETPRLVYEDPVFVDDATKARILRDIQEVELTAQPGDFGKAMSALAQHLPRFDAGSTGEAPGGPGLPKQVYVFTDLQRSSFASERGLKDPNLRRVGAELERLKADLTIVDCGADEPANVAVTRLEAADEVAGVDIPIKVTASVKNFGPVPVSDLTLDFVVDESVQGSPGIALEPGEEREVERHVSFRDKGAHRVHVSLKSDNLAVDNERSLVLEAREGVDVQIVDGAPNPETLSEAEMLAGALAPAEDGRVARDYLLRPQILPEASLGEIDLAKSPVIVLSNVISLSQEQADRLEGFVRAGGGLLVLLGAQVDAAAWNERAWKDGKGFLPARLEQWVTTPDEERYHSFDAETYQHPVLRPFAGKETRTLLQLPRFDGYWKVAWPDTAVDDPTLQALLWFAPRKDTAGREETVGDGAVTRDPALVEKRLGRGRVLVFGSTADADPSNKEGWNNFPTQGAYAYVMLWTQAAKHLAEAGGARRNIVVGEPYEAIVPSSEYASRVLLTAPNQDQVEKTLEKLTDEADRFRLVHAETWRPGVYELRAQGAEGAASGAGTGERVDYFAVNVEATEEGDLTRIDEKELRELVPELKFRLDRQKPDRGARAVTAAADQNELWRYALYGLLGVLAAESVLATLFGRRNRA